MNPRVWLDQGRVYAQWPGGAVLEVHSTGLVVNRMHVPATARPLADGTTEAHVYWDRPDRGWSIGT